MKLQDLLGRLESLKIATNDPESYVKDETVHLKLLDLLIDYIGNKEIKDKIDEIVF